MEVTLSGTTILLSAVHLANASEPIETMLVGMGIPASAVQP